MFSMPWKLQSGLGKDQSGFFPGAVMHIMRCCQLRRKLRITNTMLRFVGILMLLLICGCSWKDHVELTICCAGDSLMRPIPSHLKKFLPLHEANFNIKDWARGGLSSRTYMSYYKRRVRQRGEKFMDFILLQLGTNDVPHLYSGEYPLTLFEANLKLIVDEFKKCPTERQGSVKILIASVPPLCAPEYITMNFYIQNTLNPVIKKLSETERLFYVDNWSLLNKRDHLYRPDGIHPSLYGEKVLTQNWILAMRKAVRSAFP